MAVDCSLLAHAFIPSQATAAAIRALDEIDKQGHQMVAAAVLFTEFPSLLRKLVTTSRITKAEAQQYFDIFRRLPIAPINVSPGLLQRSWAVSLSLNQSDTYDSMGYAVAEAEAASFWTSDQRFGNAAKSQRLPNVKTFA